MKYQPQNDLIDPDESGETLDFDFDDTDEPEIREDAYVIGADGSSINSPAVVDSGARQKAPHHWVKPAAIVLGALCVALTVWNLGSLVQGPPLPPKPTLFQSNQALYMGVMKIDAYRRAHGATPESLVAAGLAPAAGYEYTRVSSTRYVLSFRNRGLKIEYDSIEPKERFFGPAKDMLMMGGSR